MTELGILLKVSLLYLAWMEIYQIYREEGNMHCIEKSW